MKKERRKIIEKCEEKLIDMKFRYQLSLSSPTLYQKDGGEVIDMAHREQQIQNSIFYRERMKGVLPEIHRALSRIKDGSYGYCEVTGEEIESNRLLAIPWARISMKACKLEIAS